MLYTDVCKVIVTHKALYSELPCGYIHLHAFSENGTLVAKSMHKTHLDAMAL